MMINTKTIAIANQKGGVGKTTTAVNLAMGLARLEQSVLLIDFDPQGNATMGCGLDSREITPTACELLMHEVSPEDCVFRSHNGQIDVIAANTNLTAAELDLMSQDAPQLVLKNQLSQLRNKYDYVLIDCPPSLSILTINALTAANSVLIPMQCEYYALEGLTSLLDTVDRVKQTVNPGLEIEGLLRTMFDSRNNLSNEVSKQISDHFESKVFVTVIPRNIRVAEAPSFGLSVMEHEPASRGSIAYKGLAGEIIRRNHV